MIFTRGGDKDMALHEELSIRIYRDMVRTRALDEQMIKNARGGVMRAGWHSGLGEESIVGPVSLLHRDDYVTYTHRGAWIAKGMDMKEIVAEFYGKATGCAKGKGGTHITKPSLGIFGRAGSQGGHFVLAAGMALAAKMRKKGQVVIMCFGDGCGTRGTLHEAMNYASVNKFPILWLCENNSYSVTVSYDKMWAVENISSIAASYAMPGKTVDGTDVVAVTEAAQEYLDRARRGEGPSLLEIKFYRWRAHVEGTTTAYMEREVVDSWRKRDPLLRFEQLLMTQGILKDRDIQKIKTDADAEVQDAQKFAESSPEPAPEDALADLYADSHT
jgi:pyruvate dehydrogenase E1 component alpha subunit